MVRLAMHGILAAALFGPSSVGAAENLAPTPEGMGHPTTCPVPNETFYLSFDTWPVADVAVGDPAPRATVGQPQFGPGKKVNGLQLDGSSYLEFSPTGNINGKACTVCLWVKLEKWGAKTYDSIFGLSDTNQNALHLERSHPDGRLRLVFGGPDTADGSKTRNFFSKAPLETQRWYHVAVAWDAARPLVGFYLDGQLQSRDDKPGPFPTAPPTLLVGAALGRLERAVAGTIDEVHIYGRCLSQDDIAGVMNQHGPLTTGSTHIAGREVLAVVRPEGATLTVGSRFKTGRWFIVGPLQPTIQVGDRTLAGRWFHSWKTVDESVPSLGLARHATCTSPRIYPAQGDAALPLELDLHAQVFQDQPIVLMWVSVRNAGASAVQLRQISLSPPPEQSNVSFGMASGAARVFTDSAGLTGSGVHPLSGPSARSHTSHGAMVVADEFNDDAVGFSAVSFERTHPRLVLSTHPGGGARRLEVYWGYPGGWNLKPGETATSERIAFHLPPAGHLPGLAGHAALEHWADIVMAVNNLKPPRHCPSGYNSWYAYRLIISEDLVLANARIIARRFAPLGCTNFQIDHGWQFKDVCGNWVPNDRFPHGFPWLAEELKKMGLSFGLWTAVSQMSEFAPSCKEHPEMLAKDAKGQPLVTDSYWFWEPHGKCYLIDPTQPAGEAFYEQAGRLARRHGCDYLKNDFQGNLLSHGLNLHDKEIIRGVPVWRKAMAAFRRGMGDDMAYHACNAPLNAVAGLCDVAWVHADLGNPGGRWDWLAQFTDQFACRYHVSGKFYWSDPDYLQVGQGDLAETQWRIAMVGLGGGPTFICDRLPDLPEERLAMIPLVLPGYRTTARPIDLFDHEGYARAWHLPVKTPWGQWHVLGLFNLDNAPTRLPVRLERLGLDAARPHLVTDFFSRRSLGVLQTPVGLGASLSVAVAPHQTRLLRLTPIADVPMVAGTDMHVTQGGVELADVVWSDGSGTLSGKAIRAPGMKGNVLVYVPQAYEPTDQVVIGSSRVATVPVTFEGNEAAWSVKFRRR